MFKHYLYSLNWFIFADDILVIIRHCVFITVLFIMASTDMFTASSVLMGGVSVMP